MEHSEILMGEAKEVGNTENLTHLTETEWEDAVETTKEKIDEPDYISLPQQVNRDKEEDRISDKHVRDTPIQLYEVESHSENAELDTEISYCDFITNYTIESPCERIDEKLIEAKPSSEFCDNDANEPKLYCQEISTQEHIFDPVTEACKQTFYTEKAEFVISLDKQESLPSLDKEESIASLDKQESIASLDKQESIASLDESESLSLEKTEPLLLETSELLLVEKTESLSIDKQESSSLDEQQALLLEERESLSLDKRESSLLDKHELSSLDKQESLLLEKTESLSLDKRESSLLDKQDSSSLDKQESSFDLLNEESIEDDLCDLSRIQKFTASSCDLISIVESLYTIKENPAYQILPAVDAPEEKFEEILFVLSKGAFCEHPEENYLVIIEESNLLITKNSHIFLLLNMKYGEISVEKNILKIDNRMGRCVFVRCDFADVLPLKAKIELHCLKHWQTDCLQLVHYPLKYHQNVIIIDIGSCSTRAGILMDQPTLPTLFFPTICATDKRTGTSLYGMEALHPEVRQHSNLSFPVRPTIKITKHTIDIDLMEGLFKKIFYDLKVDPTQYTVQVCLPRNLSINAQTALVKLLLETLMVKAVSLTNQALLTLYAHDVSTAVVVDIGDRTDVLPVVDGFIVENGVTKLPHGGQRLIHHMKHGLAEKRITLSNDIDSFIVQYIIENLAYVADDYDIEMQISSQLPDIVMKAITLQPVSTGSLHCKSITLEEARFKIPEGLFNPNLWGLDSPGIHHLVQKAIQATSVDARKRVAENIYVSGGVTMLPGFVERLNKEVTKLSKAKIVPKVYASNYRYHCSYIGACKFAKMEVFPQVCINLQEYTKNSMSSLKKCALYF